MYVLTDSGFAPKRPLGSLEGRWGGEGLGRGYNPQLIHFSFLRIK